jgi:hypothetical protein
LFSFADTTLKILDVATMTCAATMNSHISSVKCVGVVDGDDGDGEAALVVSAGGRAQVGADVVSAAGTNPTTSGPNPTIF